MKNLSKIAAGVFLSALVVTSCQNEELSNESLESPDETLEINAEATNDLEGDIIPGEYIVVFKDSEIEPSSKVLQNRSFVSREDKSKSVRDISEAVSYTHLTLPTKA